MNKILTLTTDFGLQDAYVAAMKGVILSINPEIRIIDISHNISPQDVMEAAFLIKNVYPLYPQNTTHIAVIDPGVGTDRAPVVLRKGSHYFVGPDNGLFSLVLDGGAPDEIYELDNAEYWRSAVPSNTFHGRDIFASAGAHLASGVSIDQLGTRKEALKPLHWALPIVDAQGVQGWVVHIDRYGNCITNIPKEMLHSNSSHRPVKCYIGSTMLDVLSSTYSDREEGEPLMLYGSDNLLEIAINSGNASKLLSIRKGDPVNILFVDDK